MASEKARIRKVIEALRGYTPAGMPVTWTFHGLNYTGKIARQGGVGPGAVFFVKLDEPVSFEEHARRLGLDKEKTSALYEQMIADNCLDMDGKIQCLWAYWRDLEIMPKRGRLTEYTEDDPEHVMAIKNFPGKIVGIEGDIILMEVFEPITFMRAPEAIDYRKIQKGFYEPTVVAVGLDTAEAWKRRDPATFPQGRWSDDKYEWILAQPIPLEEFRIFCDKHFPNEPGCLYQGVLLWIIPIDTREPGAFRPMREDLADYFAGTYQVAIDEM